MKRSVSSLVQTALIGFLIIGLLTAPTTSWGAEVLNYRYSVDGENPLDYWFSGDGIRIDFEDGNQKFTILYRSDDNTMNYLMHHEEQAIVLDEAFLEKTIARLEQIRRKLENLPERQRKMMERSMGDAVKSIHNDQTITTPTLVESGRTEWKGRSAVRNTVMMDGDTTGTALFLEEAPLEFNPEEQTNVDRFQSLMEKLLKVTGTMSKSLEDTQLNGNQSFHLLGDRLFRLAVFQSTENRIELTDWSRHNVPESHFSIPKNFSVKKPGNSMGGGVPAQ